MELSYLNSAIHNHSNLCDGKNTLEQMALAAWQQGFQVLGLQVRVLPLQVLP